jgi:hypothetical protein
MESMAANVTKTPDAMLKRQMIVSELYQAGNSFIDISRILREQHGIKISAVQCHYDMKAVRKMWRTSLNNSIQVMQQRELARLDWVEMEATKAWGRTVGLHKITTVTETDVKVNAVAEFPAAVERTTRRTKLPANGHKHDAVAKMMAVKLPARKTTTNTQMEMHAGNLKCLEVILHCVEQRRAMLGLDAPQKIEFTEKRVDSMTDDELVEEMRRVLETGTPQPDPLSTAVNVTPGKYGPN